MPRLNQQGIVQLIPMLLVVAAIGVLAYFAISSVAPFKNGLFGSLYPKPSTIASSQQTITFDNLPTNQPINAVYPSGLINWGKNIWGTNPASGLFKTPNLEFNSGRQKNASFQFVVPRRVVSLQAFNRGGKVSTVSLACSGQATVTIQAITNTISNVNTNWAANCSPVTVSSSNGYDTVFDNLVIDDASGGTGITPTPTSVPSIFPSLSPSATPPTRTPTPQPSSTPTPRPTLTPTPITPPPPVGGLWIPPVQMTWQWMIDHPFDVNNAKDMGLVDPTGKVLTSPVPQMYDIDGFMNGIDPNCNIKDIAGNCVPGQNDAVNQLHRLGKKVVCYIDTGVYENYREDAYKFPASVIGNADSGWNGSYWLDIRQTGVLFPIMEARIKMCKDKGYDSIEPDEMVNYSNNSGFPLTYQQQLTYNRGIAALAHKYGISIALKDDPEQAGDLVGNFDWMLNEECYQYNECDLLNPFSNAGKFVADVEYKVQASNFCANSNSRNWNSMQMPLNLNGGRYPCR